MKGIQAAGKRAQWGSSFGFIMASVGAAVGMGNIWGFPYKLGQGRRICLPRAVSDHRAYSRVLSCSRNLRSARNRASPVRGQEHAQKLGFVGVFSLLACFFILCYYSFFAACCVNTCCELGFVTIPRFCGICFHNFTGGDCHGRVEKGIDKSSRVHGSRIDSDSCFYIAANLQAARASGLSRFCSGPTSQAEYQNPVDGPDAGFLLAVSRTGLHDYIRFLYREKGEPAKSALLIPLFDTGTAVLAAMAIMPAVFSYGMSPATGPSLMFEVVPKVFSGMPGGRALAALFYFLVFLAAITSAVSMLETLVSAAIEKGRVTRRKSVGAMSVLVALCGLPVCLSFGKCIGNLKTDFFEIYEFIAQYVLMTVCSLITCLAVVYIWKAKKSLPAAFGQYGGTLGRLWLFLLKFVTPALLLYVILSLIKFV
jgi:NSS family neurotransmitter:Na+ symporter